MRSRPFVTMPVVVLALALSACAADPNGSTRKLDVSALAEETSAFQAAILADGVVDPSEYERAILAHRQCVQEAGAKVGDLYLIRGNQTTFDWEVEAPTQSEVDAINSNADACLGEYRDTVALVWAEQAVLTPREKERIQPKVVESLQQANVRIDKDATFDEVIAAIRALEDHSVISQCVEKFPEYFSVSSVSSSG